MPIQKTDRNTTWFITDNDKTWTLAEGAKIEPPSNNHGISEGAQSGSTIRVLGDIHVRGLAAGVTMNGSDSTIFVGAESFINARNAEAGLYSASAGGNIENHGRIEGGNEGIDGAIWGDVQNYGLVSGMTAVNFDGSGSQIYNYGTLAGSSNGVTTQAAGTYVENAKHGEITGADNAIGLLGTGTAEIVNRGLIESDDNAILSEGSILSVRNTGRIVGDVILDAGADSFDTRGGTVAGKVYGGDGDDTFMISSKVVIVESAGMGSGTQDIVYSTVTYRLPDNVEQLWLQGAADIDAVGNADDNYLSGNKGDNLLLGKGGFDTLAGRAGNDRLTGGGMQDVFMFGAGGDVDHVTDFTDGTDLIKIAGVNDQMDFDALDIRQINGDTVISLGGGDKLIIDGLLKSDLDFSSDFTV